MLALRTALGVTDTTWDTTVPCKIAGQSTTFTNWDGVLCDSTGSVVSLGLLNSNLKGLLPSEISTLTALTFLSLQGNLLNYRLDTFASYLQSLTTLADIRLHYNYLFGEIPSYLVGLPKLTQFGAAANYLIGTVPALASGLRTLDLRFNFLTDLPAVTYTWCGGNNNCLTTPSKCASVGSAQRPVTDCAFCNTTKGVGPFCVGPGGVCTLEGNAAVAAGILNSFTQPVIPLACMVPPVPLKDTSAMLALKSSLGVTFTTWDATVQCKLAGFATTATVWSGVLCDGNGSVVSIALNNAKLKGSLATDISTLTTLTYLNLQGNLFNYRLDSFATFLRLLPVLADIRLHYNYFIGDIPSFLVNLPKLTQFGAMYNYLTGSVPALASGLRSIEVRSNFLTDVPTANYTYCGGAGNCLLTPSKCASGAAGSTQRSAADCAFCGTSNGVGPFCWSAGGVCTPDVAASVAAGVVNLPTEPTRPMSCVGSPVVPIKEIGVMLALKSSLGMSSSTWGAYVPCTIKGTTAPVPTWAGVLCDADGNVLKIELFNTGLTGDIAADISKLTALSFLSLYKQLFQAPLAGFTSNLYGLSNLKELYLQYNWLYGTVPTAIVNMPSLTSLGLGYNYLTGSFPAGTSVRALDLRANFFYTMGSMSLIWCDGHTNCFTNPSVCGMAGTVQRPAAQCAICGTTNAQPPFCGGVSICAPDSIAAAAAGTPNIIGSPTLPMVCSGVPIDAADAVVLLALKSSLGVTLSNWNTGSLCAQDGQPLLTAQWGGVRCTAAGKVTSIALTRQKLQGSIHPDISKLTTLTYLDFGYNLFQGRLDLFAAPLKPLTTLKALFFHYNYFAGSIPSAFATLPALTSLGLFSNYLTGTMPIPTKTLLALDVGFNFLSGTFPKLPLMFCAGDNNCFLNSTACRTYGIVQRPAGACAICGTAAGQGDLCFGGSCAPSAAAAVSAGTVNSPNQPILPMACADNPAAPMDTGSALALLNVKSALGVTFTSWLAASPCAIANASITIGGTWTGVLCSSAGAVLSVNLSSSALAGSMHSDISKLTALTYLDLSNNFLLSGLASFASSFSGLKSLQQLSVPLLYPHHSRTSILNPWCSHVALTVLSLMLLSLMLLSFVLLSLVVHSSLPLALLCSPSLLSPQAPQQQLVLGLPASDPHVSSRPHASVRVQNTCTRDHPVSAWMPLSTSHCIHLSPASEPPLPFTMHVLHLSIACFFSPPSPSSNPSPLHPHPPNPPSTGTTGIAAACGASSTTQRAAAACDICNSAAAQGLLCWGGMCLPDVTATTAHPDGLAPPTMSCSGAPVININSVDAAALAALKSAMGVTFTTWVEATYCTVAPTAIIPGTWNGVLCNSGGRVVSLTIGYNYLTGALPNVTSPLAVVDGRLCSGGLCTVNATDLVALGAPNSAASPTLPLICVGAAFVAMDSVQAGAMLNLKASLGVTFTDWKADSPCSLPGAVAAGSWSGVTCDATGKVLGIVLSSQKLAGSIHSDISKLSMLTSLDLQSNLLQGRLDSFTASIKTPLVLKELALQFNYLIGPFPSALLALSTLSKLSVAYNYLTGPFPTVPASAKSLDVQGNFLSGSFPTNALTYCAATTNCLTDANNCASLGITQRTAADCAICGTPFGQGTLCGGVTCLVNTTDITAPPTASSPARNLYCTPVALDTNTTTTLLALKTVLGVTATDWSATTVVLQPKALKSSSVPLATTVGACTVEGQTPAPGSWTGVFCNTAGAVVALVLPNQKLTGSLSADVSKLTALTALSAMAALPLCGGGLCTPNSAAPAAAGTPNTDGQPLLTMYCQGGPMDASMLGAMLNLKASLGVTLTSWANTAPCNIAGQMAVVGAWAKVYCDTAGKVISIDLTEQLLKGSMHADITKLTTLTSLVLDSNMLQGRLAYFTSGFKGLSALKIFSARLNFFAGPLPTALLNLPTLTSLDVRYNYLTGTVPTAIGTALKTLSIAGNFLVGTIGTFPGVTCSAAVNCLTSQGGCTSGGTFNRAGCNICGSADGQGTLCGGGLCVPNATAAVAANQTPTLSTPVMPMYCTGVIIDAASAAVLSNIKAALGVTFTDWTPPAALLKPKAAGSSGSGSVALTDWLVTGGYCTADGQTPIPGTWSGVFCNSLGQPVSLKLDNQKLTGSLPSDISKLSTLTMLDVSSNFFRALIDSWASPIKSLTNLLSLRLNNNYLYGSVPLWLVSFSKLTNLELSMNALTGTFPSPISTALKRLMVDQNFMAGTFPANSATYCTAYYNCITTYTTCPAVYPNLPIPSFGCQICGMTDALGTACMGNPCVPITPTPITAVNKWNPVPVMRCDPVPIQAAQASALQAMVPGLWTQPTCTIAGQAYISGTLPRIFCNPSGMVLDIVLNGVRASGFFPTDVVKLSMLSRLDLSVNLFSNRLDTFLAPFIPLKSLVSLRLHQNYFSGSFPANISALTALTELRLNLNYLTGSMPAALPATLKAIDLSNNYLVGTFPTTTATSVACASNCLQDASKCLAASTQRAAGGCAICETPDATGRMCGGGTCTPNATALIAANTVNADTASLYCLGATMDPVMAAALLNMRAGASYNYLYGSMPTPGAALKAIALDGNWLSGTFPGAGFSSCSATANCLASIGACTTLGTVQRDATACPVCDTLDGSGTVCGGGTCAPDTTGPLASSTPNSATAAVLPRFCVGVPLDATQGNILLALKTTLGVTFSDWTAATLAAPKATSPKPKAGKRRELQGRGSGLLYDWKAVGSCTIDGQTPIAGSWTGVRCSPLGQIVGLDLRSQLLSGTVHSDISKLSTLTSLRLSSNLFFNRLDSYIVPITFINFNWFYGTVPTTIVNMLALTFLVLSNNYLTGTLPKPAATLKGLDTEYNFLSGTFPAASLAFCSARANCFLDASACVNIDGTAQRGAGCNVCASPKGQLPLCGGAVCTPDPSAYLASKVPNSATAPTLALKCPAFPLDAATSSALVNIGAALGVTHSDWSTNSVCNILGQNIAPKTWPGVWCSGSGAVISLILNNLNLRGTIHADMTKLTGLTYMHLGYNLLYGRLSTFISNITPLTAIATLNLNFNYLYDSIPSTLFNMASLTTLRLSANYLTGTLPAVPAKLTYLAVNHNFLAGAFPSQNFQFCDIRNNCFSGLGTCYNAYGVAQRTSGCNICGTGNAAPPLCGGTVCILNATDALAAGTVNGLGSIPPPMYCAPVTIDPTAAQVLLVLRAALGVTQSTWLVDSPCDVAGNPPMATSWAGVGCDVTGQVVQLELPGNLLRGNLPSDVSKLTGLTRVNMALNLLEARLIEWASPLSSLKSLRHLALNYNWFSGPLPSYLLTLSSLTTLVGTSIQRAAADCAICGAANASTVLCGGGVCAPNTATQLATKTPNGPSLLVLPLVCTGVLPILANMKTALGVPHQEWGVGTLCTVTNQLKGPNDMWGVYCNAQGTVVDFYLKQRFMRGVMHPDISKFTALTALDLSSNFLSGPLDPFISPLTGLTALKYLVMSYNFFSGSIPSTISAIKSLYMLSLGWNYLTGTVPVPGTALQVLDLENNWLNGKFPSTANWYFCTARANCFNDPTPCKNNNNQGITQRPSCAICNSADATGTLCGGTVACQPDPAAVKAVTAVPTTSTPVLALTCPPVPPVTTDATAASALMNIKTALGVTYTNWAASSTCNAVGSSGGGGFSGVECNSAGQPVKM
ncbi:unnamed protein product, partial [Closterium sp. Yama58-4]